MANNTIDIWIGRTSGSGISSLVVEPQLQLRRLGCRFRHFQADGHGPTRQDLGGPEEGM